MVPIALERCVPPDVQDRPAVQRGGGALARAEREGGATTFADGEAVSISAGVARGDGASLEALYRAWFDRAFGLARRFTGRDESFCLDIVQDAMMRAIRGLRPQPSGAALDGWMTMAVRSAAVDGLRRETRRAARERGRLVPGPGARDGPVAADFEALLAKLAELDPAEAEVLRRRFGGGSLRGMAEATGTTTGGVHGRVRRAIATLRRLLPKEDQ